MSTASQRRRKDDFCAAFELDLERIATLTEPYIGALRLVHVAKQAGDAAALQNAMSELAEAARAFKTIESIAELAERRLAIHRRREPRG